jgi:3-carboxy-cis,cis-muconate cycloisomerase
MTSRLIDCLATTDALADIFSDASMLRAMLDFEAALARVEAQAGIIPPRAADIIAQAARTDDFDPLAIARAARQSATPSIPLVEALTRRVSTIDESSAAFVHWGATSQDVADSAMLVLLKRAHGVLKEDHVRLVQALRSLSDKHASTVMLGRTLLQPATPITFGLKAAGWYAAAERSWTSLHGAFDSAAVIQFGGASGTLAALGQDGPSVGRALAHELGLAPAAPWHTHRDRLANVVASSSLYTAALAKIARDVALMMQAEVGEAAESGGGSSTMTHKRNPSGCAVTLAAGVRMPGVVSALFAGMIQEHERSVGGWQAEWPLVADAVQTTGAALASIAQVIETLEVYPERMRANIDATNGIIFAERASILLRPSLGRATAQRLVEEAVKRSRTSGATLAEALKQSPEVARVLSPGQLEELMRPEAYLGAAEMIRKELLSTTSAHGLD